MDINKVCSEIIGKGLRSKKTEGGLRTRDEFHKKSEPEKPLISIITVVRNGEKYLEQTIQSVLNQTYDNIEYIIIDGASTDGTLDIIKKYEDQIAYWVSEPDGGIYDAMNKGIELATGEIIGILNSDDWYKEDAVSKVTVAFRKSPNSSVFHGDMGRYTLSGKLDRVVVPMYPRMSLIYGCTINHPTCFVDMKTYKQLRGFNLSLDLASDYEFLLRVWKSGGNFYYINSVLTNFRVGGYSSNFIKSAVQAHEARRLNGINKTISFISMLRLFILHYTKNLLELLGIMKAKL